MTNEERLIKVYQQAQQQLINIIAYKEARGSVTAYQEQLLKQVNGVLKQLEAYSVTWARDAINESYALGVNNALQGLKTLEVSTVGAASFAKLHTAAIDVITRNTQSMLLSGTAFVGREIEDAVRQAGLDAVASKLSTGATVKEASRLVKKKLIDQGLNAIKDKRGRRISLDAYADTVARSTTREATNTAMLNQVEYEGYDLVKMSSHATTCPVCAAYQGRVYSISGRAPGYPSLWGTAFAGKHANIHPRCKHVLMPYIPALADDPEGDKAFSSRPFDIDNRSKAAIDKYNQRQAEARKLREDRDQWQRYKLALGDDAPKTLAGFRRMKQANSERYLNLKSDYREATKDATT